MIEVYLTRLFLPHSDNQGVIFPFRLFKQTERTFIFRLGGVVIKGEAMELKLIDAVDIVGRKVIVYLEDDREISLDFSIPVRRVSNIDGGNRMVVETTDKQITSYYASQLAQQQLAAT